MRFLTKPFDTLYSVQFYSTKLKQLSQSFNAQLIPPLPKKRIKTAFFRRKEQKFTIKNSLECCCSKFAHENFKIFSIFLPFRHKLPSATQDLNQVTVLLCKNIRIQSQNSLAHTGSFRKLFKTILQNRKYKTVHF
jgi:hypothetical protein